METFCKLDEGDFLFPNMVFAILYSLETESTYQAFQFPRKRYFELCQS